MHVVSDFENEEDRTLLIPFVHLLEQTDFVLTNEQKEAAVWGPLHSY